MEPVVAVATPMNPSIEYFEQDPSDNRLMTIVLGEEDFLFGDFRKEPYTSTPRGPKPRSPMLVKEVRRRMETMKLPLGKRVPPACMNKKQLVTWLKSNPVLKPEEKPYFRENLAALLDSLGFSQEARAERAGGGQLQDDDDSFQRALDQIFGG
mmetsp:Transcript_8877/g.20540  ORF Transcript_8877/g.20540 Transcript_8877/m.20540 type:complete len:153 (+) Transcript_8877:891-1349(+)